MLRKGAFCVYTTNPTNGAKNLCMSPQTGELLVNEVAPRIRSSLVGVNKIGSEDPEELEQDAVAMAAGLLESIEAGGSRSRPGMVRYSGINKIGQGRATQGSLKGT